VQVFSTFLSLSCAGIYSIGKNNKDVPVSTILSLSITLHSGKTAEDVGRRGGGEEKADASSCRAKE